jgi:putative DNA primase/helicase
MSSDSVGMYLNEANANKSLNHYTVKYVYGEYRKYCIESGYKTVNKVNFEQRLEHHGYTLDKVRKVKSVFIQIESID